MNKLRFITKAYFILFLTLFLSNNTCLTQNQQQNNCIIILDRNDNDNVGSLVFNLMNRLQSAITEQSTPLLISTSLWNSFIERKKYVERALEDKKSPFSKMLNLHKTINEKLEQLSNHYNILSNDAIHNKKLIIQKINQKFYKPKNQIPVYQFQRLLTYCTHFDTQEWDIYSNHAGFLLLIPKKYSADNDTTGFNTLHLDVVENPLDTPYLHLESSTQKSIVHSLPDFFLTHDNFTDTPMPYAWNIILAGHGGAQYTEERNNNVITWNGQPWISDLAVYELKDVLSFFNTRVNTNLFNYFGCYSGGNHITLVFDDIKKNPYNFPIICSTLTDCTSYCKWTAPLPSPETSHLFHNNLQFDTEKNCWHLPLSPAYQWKNFFDALKTIDFSPQSLIKLQTALPSITNPAIANIPMICLAHTSNFFPLLPNDAVKIDSLLLETAHPKENSITLNNPRTILVEKSIIEPKIILKNPSTILRIISIKPSTATHYFKSISSTHFLYLSDVFWQAEYQMFNKTFLIDECSFPYTMDFQAIFPKRDDLIIKNVLIVQKKSQVMRIYFTLNDQAMMVIAHKPNEEGSATTIQQITPITDAAREKYEEMYKMLKTNLLDA
jgi:hypothetical protein